jgi:hypothetical protein
MGGCRQRYANRGNPLIRSGHRPDQRDGDNLDQADQSQFKKLDSPHPASRSAHLRHHERWEAAMNDDDAIRITFQIYVDRGKVDKYFYRRGSENTLKAMEYLGGRGIVDTLIDTIGHFLNGFAFDDAETTGEIFEFEQAKDGSVPDVAFVIDVPDEETNFEVIIAIYTQRSDGTLRVVETADFPDKPDRLKQIILLSTELFKTFETSPTNAQEPISKTSTNGGGGDD